MGKTMISVTQLGVQPGDDKVQTAGFQAALDQVWLSGGGVVQVPAGRYLIGSIRLRSNTTLYLCAGAELYGVRDPAAYEILKNDALEPLPAQWISEKGWEPFRKGIVRSYDFMKPCSPWTNGLIRAVGAENVAVIGEPGSLIDGQDCYNENGEEYYRGPHGVSMHHCRNITLRGYTIRNTGNWAHLIYHTVGITVNSVVVQGGHDGVHCRGCTNITIQDCEFYTGDDCIAGCANVNVLVTDCVFNTACSGMRFGGTNILVRNSKFYGPAKYFFRGSLSKEEKRDGAQAHRPHRVNMLSAFTYLADFSVPILEEPGNLIIKDCTIDNVDRFLCYNFSGNAHWQTCKPLAAVKFENIKATGIELPLTAYGSAELPVDLTLKHVDVSFRDDVKDVDFLHLAYYGNVWLDDVHVTAQGDMHLIKHWTQGNISLANVTCSAPENEWIVEAQEPFYCKAI